MTADLIAGRTLAEWRDFARTDYCLDQMVPSDLRALLDTITALQGEVERLQTPYDDLYADALSDAKSDAQDFDGDLWIEVRKYLTRLGIDWRDYQDDGITAEEAVEYISNCMDEETARAEAAEAKLARMEEALLWCSGSQDFQEGGIAREGWMKLCAPLIYPAALQGEASHDK